MAITISGSGIVEANLADNAVTLAKMASGTDGEILTYDASGNPVAVSVGTDGQVLTSTGAGSPPAFEAAAAAGNTPAFMAYSTTNTVSVATWSRANFHLEFFDTDNCFDSSANHRFIPSESGKYFLYCQLEFSQLDNGLVAKLAIRKNGTELIKGEHFVYHPSGTGGGPHNTMPISLIVDANGSTDYFEIYVYQASGTRILQSSGTATYSSSFFGYKLAGA